jgi:hypothetical protein
LALSPGPIVTLVIANDLHLIEAVNRCGTGLRAVTRQAFCLEIDAQ